MLVFKGYSDLQVNHKKPNKQNNKLYNLEYVTNKENMQHAYKNKLMNNLINYNIRKRIRIKQYDLQGNFIKEYESINQASKENNISVSGIFNCLNNKFYYKTAGGFIWKKI